MRYSPIISLATVTVLGASLGAALRFPLHPSDEQGCKRLAGFNSNIDNAACRAKCEDEGADPAHCQEFTWIADDGWFHKDASLPADSCFFQYNWFTKGHLAKHAMAIYKKVPGPVECQEHCQATQDCALFIWEPNPSGWAKKNCYLYNTNITVELQMPKSAKKSDISDNLCKGKADCLKCNGKDTTGIVDRTILSGPKFCIRPANACVLSRESKSNPWNPVYCSRKKDTRASGKQPSTSHNADPKTRNPISKGKHLKH